MTYLTWLNALAMEIHASTHNFSICLGQRLQVGMPRQYPDPFQQDLLLDCFSIFFSDGPFSWLHVHGRTMRCLGICQVSCVWHVQNTLIVFSTGILCTMSISISNSALNTDYCVTDSVSSGKSFYFSQAAYFEDSELFLENFFSVNVSELYSNTLITSAS